MKKLYFLAFSFLVTSLSFGQAFTATYDFAGVTNTSGMTDPTPVPNITGLTFGSFTVANPDASLNSTGSGRFSFGNQPLGGVPGNDTYAAHTGTIDLTRYFTVTITPNEGYTVDLSKITFRSQRSGTGIRTYSVRSSVDNYGANLPASVEPANAEISVEAGNVFFRTHDAITTGQNGSTITLGSAYEAVSTPVTFRFYGWNADAEGGTFSIDDVAITGAVNVLGVNQNAIAGLQVYPNPVTNGNLFITSDSGANKTVSIYNVLGKEVVKANITTQPINVSSLTSGVYIVKITEEGKTATRKLVIK
ncbi:MAG: T9SS type A sorting domain-containing protein [Flavobacterium sp.]|nr:T9SS type A sorting domain-containing protein [Flavobacterium sp.]